MILPTIQTLAVNAPTTPKEYLKEVFGNEFENAKKVIECESGFDEDIKSPTGDYGLFQINYSAHWKQIKGDTKEEKEMNLKNPYYNIDFAYKLFLRRHWLDWYKSYDCHRLK